MNNAAINIFFVIFFSIYLRENLLGNVAILLKLSEKLSCCFSKKETPFPHSHQQYIKALFFPNEYFFLS